MLVLSNSLGTSLELWSENVAALTRSFRVVRYDQRGHGDSDVPSEPFGVDELGRDVLRLLDDLGVERLAFCGVSMGGATRMWLAVNARSGSTGWSSPARPRSSGSAKAGSSVRRSSGRTGSRRSRTRSCGAGSRPGFRPDLVARFRAGLVGTPRRGLRRLLRGALRLGLRDRLGEIAAPTLVIAAPTTPPPRPSRARSSRSGFQARSSSSPTPHTWRTCRRRTRSRRGAHHLVLTEAA